MSKADDLRRYAEADKPREGLRVYQLPQSAYALVQDVREKLGALIACEVECVLGGSVRQFNWTEGEDLKHIRRLALARNVEFPEEAFPPDSESMSS